MNIRKQYKRTVEAMEDGEIGNVFFGIGLIVFVLVMLIVVALALEGLK